MQKDERKNEIAIIDAKSVYDMAKKDTAGGRQDRRIGIEMSIIRESMHKVGSKIRWIPHPRMPADMMTHSDVTKCNAALTNLIKTGRMRLLDENEEMNARKDKPKPGRSKKASQKHFETVLEQSNRSETAGGARCALTATMAPLRAAAGHSARPRCPRWTPVAAPATGRRGRRRWR